MALRRFLRHHGLTLFLLLTFLGLLFGQFFSGLRELNRARLLRGEPPLGGPAYFASPHFLEATSENWESEFFQMFVYVTATAFLYQQGSAESKDPNRRHSHHTPSALSVPRDAPWPVRRGGWVLRLYENSLALAFLLLFLGSLALHLGGRWRLYNEGLAEQGRPPATLGEYFTSARFWFESLQNWQSEFLAMLCMVVLTIFLRQKNSPESKEVATSHWRNDLK